MKKEIKYLMVFIFMLSFFILPVIAMDIDISDNPLTITAYNTTVNILSVNYPINNQNMTLNFTSYIDNNTNLTVCQIIPQQLTFNNYFIRNTTQIVDVTVMDKYLDCVNQQALLLTQNQTCLNSLSDCVAQNVSQVKSDLINCTNDKTNINMQLIQQTNSYNQVNKTLTDTQNQRMLFLIGGLAGGILGTLGLQGKLTKVKDKQIEQFGKQTAG